MIAIPQPTSKPARHGAEFLARIQEDDAREAVEYNNYVTNTGIPMIETALADYGSGSGKRVLVFDSPELPIRQFFADWVGPDGSVHLARNPLRTQQPDDSRVEAAIATTDRSNVHLASFDALEPRTYDVVYAHRTQYWTPLEDDKRADLVKLAARTLTPGGLLMMSELDFVTWAYSPPAPALERLETHVMEQFQYDFRAGVLIPQRFAELGVKVTLQTLVTNAPADGWLARNTLSRAAAFAAIGKLPVEEVAALTEQAKLEYSDPTRFVIEPMLLLGHGIV